MATKELERGRRGLLLYIERHNEFRFTDDGSVEVPASDLGSSYSVDLHKESCTCPDHSRRPEMTCKHMIAAEMFRIRKARRA